MMKNIEPFKKVSGTPIGEDAEPVLPIFKEEKPGLTSNEKETKCKVLMYTLLPKHKRNHYQWRYHL